MTKEQIEKMETTLIKVMEREANNTGSENSWMAVTEIACTLIKLQNMQ